jgi:hypothetical protein
MIEILLSIGGVFLLAGFITLFSIAEMGKHEKK